MNLDLSPPLERAQRFLTFRIPCPNCGVKAGDDCCFPWDRTKPPVPCPSRVSASAANANCDVCGTAIAEQRTPPSVAWCDGSEATSHPHGHWVCGGCAPVIAHDTLVACPATPEGAALLRLEREAGGRARPDALDALRDALANDANRRYFST
jgi:hypothetical protein